ncbi:MAG: DUF1501 domain-containing protein [SAR324 cluster bacterium]|nr:DUF1501 domain-containing protein [SAR324 cluster bacterium]
MLSRRDFLRRSLKVGAAALLPLGMSARLPGLPGGILRADPPSGRPLMIVVHARGGWDPTMWIDPKGSLATVDTNGVITVPDPDPVNRHYLVSEILQASGISYAPSFDVDGHNEAFMTKYASRMLVVNGVNMTTNSHSNGTMYAARGSFDFNPVLAALYSGSYGPTLALSFIGTGFTETLGVVPVSASGRSDLLINAAFPNLIDPYASETDVSNRFFPQAVDDLIDGMLDNQGPLELAQPLPGDPLQDLQSIYALYNEAQGSSSALTLLRDSLPSEADLASNPFPDNPLLRQALIPIAGFKAGVCHSCQISTGGFDTHGNHDASQSNALRVLLQGIDGIIVEAERQGIPFFIVVTSDFGRTPGYNSGNGKDHHPVTSFVFIGEGVPGARVVGGSTHFQTNLHVDQNLGLLPEGTQDIELTSNEIHRAIRTFLGIVGTPLDNQYPLPGTQDLPIFVA